MADNLEPGAVAPRRLLLVDGPNYYYRAYHAMPDLRGPDGFPTGAIHGMVNMMNWLREQVPAEMAHDLARMFRHFNEAGYRGAPGAADRLFETLDPRTRQLALPGGETVLITDTVGFITMLVK